MKNTEKTRGAEFYNVLALKVLERGTTTQDEFRELIESQVDSSIPMPKIRAIHI